MFSALRAGVSCPAAETAATSGRSWTRYLRKDTIQRQNSTRNATMCFMSGLTWDDSEDIALALAEKYPEADPLAVRFTDLHKWITELAGFSDDPAKSTEGKLEAIQMAWYEEYKANR